jgi:hypothetical protein
MKAGPRSAVDDAPLATCRLSPRCCRTHGPGLSFRDHARTQTPNGPRDPRPLACRSGLLE